MRKSFLLLLVILPYLVFAQETTYSKVSPYTAHFLSIYNQKTPESTKKIQKCFFVKSLNNQSYVNAFISLNENADLDALRANGAKINTQVANLITAQIPVQNVSQISQLSDVKYLQIAVPVRKRMDKARTTSNVDKVQSGLNLPTPFTGKDVVVGVIDNGFEYGHINFWDANGTNLRVKHVWDQNLTGTAPTGYSYGVEYTTQAAILAAKYDTRSETHATHVTGIAAGGDKNNGNTYYGIATDADIALVSYNNNDQSTDNVSISDGIKYIYDYATSVNKPCVINMSLGTHIGPHDGTSAFDQVCDGLQGKGRLLVGAAGNEGGDNLHISQTFTSSVPTLKSFFTFYDSSTLYGETDIWGDANTTFTIQVVVYKKSTGVNVYATTALDAATTNQKTYTLKSTNGAVGTISVYTERNALNNKPNAYVNVDMTSITTGNYIGIIITGTAGTTVHAWADDWYSYFASNNVTGWSSGNSTNSMGEIGGTGKRIISVGAYVTKTAVTSTTNQSINTSSRETINKITSFSSKGPTIDGRTKPDITAPGSIIVSSFSSAVLDSADYKDTFVKKSTVNGTDYYYGEMEGTSMATPYVTGVLATWLGVKPDLTPEDVRSILQSTSISDTYTGTIPTTGSSTWGYGKIDAWNGIKQIVNLSKIDNVEIKAENVLLYPNPTVGNFSIFFTNKDSNVKLAIYSISGKLMMTKQLGNVDTAQESIFNISDFPKGVYLVSLNGDLHYKNYQILLQ